MAATEMYEMKACTQLKKDSAQVLRLFSLALLEHCLELCRLEIRFWALKNLEKCWKARFII